MRITADHAFHIGSQHLRGGMPCQDYAMSGGSGTLGVAIISDGCSSGGKTDVGARIIAHSTAIALAASPTFDQKAVDFNCHWADLQAKSALCLLQEDMLATCGYVAASDRLLAVRIIGDGVIAAKRRGGDLVMTKVDWANNTPIYRAYAEDDYASFIHAHGGHDAMAVNVTRHVRGEDAPTDKVIPQPLYSMLSGFADTVPIRDFDFVAVLSDGVTQVDGMGWRDVVAELMNFKSVEGDFVKRRMNRFLKDCLKHGKGPIDDISMAAIHIDHEVE